MFVVLPTSPVRRTGAADALADAFGHHPERRPFRLALRPLSSETWISSASNPKRVRHPSSGWTERRLGQRTQTSATSISADRKALRDRR